MPQLTPGKEFERKFLVRAPLFTDAIRRSARQLRIRQGYLALAPLQVRVRHTHGEGYVLEIKGAENLEIDCGELHDADGRLMLEAAAKVAAIVEKVRHEIPAGFDGLKWEVDLFQGDNAPLLVAEIEMPEEDYPLLEHGLPSWIGDEVTDEPEFKNKNLAVKPFRRWSRSKKAKTLKRMGL